MTVGWTLYLNPDRVIAKAWFNLGTSTSARPARSQPPHNDDGMSKARRTYASRKIIPRVYVYTKCLPGGDQIHVYDDGTECPAVSEGDVVNKYWGTTKAGKARKRKAQACLTCREKKIKVSSETLLLDRTKTKL